MNKKVKKNDNFLDLIPTIVDGQDFIEDKDGLIKIIVERNGILERIVRPLAKTPKHMKIDLDSHGSCAWKAIDGVRTVEEIGVIVKEKFGDEAEPLYERLATFLNILRNNKFITLEKNN